MPPKKRGRPPGASSTAPQRPTKRVRVGETSIIGEQNSSETTESGRPRRSSAGEPNYGRNRATAPNNASASKSKTATTGKDTMKYKKKGASRLFGRRRPSFTAKPEPEATETAKRGRGRPKSTKATAEPAVQEKTTTPKKAVGRPKKTVERPAKAVGRPKNTAKAVKSTKAPAAKPKGPKALFNQEDEVEDSDTLPNGTSHDVDDDGEDAEADEPERQYWLMKAEPDSRIENGVDVKFSIDDLKAKGGSEAWDGVRNYGARNNMRAMRKGDVAFFYHSNCKVPGIAGVMEIVGEHAVDEMAFDPKHPYYDPKSTRDSPKWDVVYVQYVRKFPDIVKLSDLRSFAKSGGALEKMQLLNQGRLSVSAVTPQEWDFILTLVEDDDGEDDDEQVEDTLVENVNGTKYGKDSNAENLVDDEAKEDGDEDDDDEGNVDGEKNDDGEREDGVEGVNGDNDVGDE